MSDAGHIRCVAGGASAVSSLLSRSHGCLARSIARSITADEAGWCVEQQQVTPRRSRISSHGSAAGAERSARRDGLAGARRRAIRMGQGSTVPVQSSRLSGSLKLLTRRSIVNPQ